MSEKWRHDALHQLALAANDFPELRLCQLIVNVTGRSDPFYVTDEHLAECLKNYRLAHSIVSKGNSGR